MAIDWYFMHNHLVVQIILFHVSSSFFEYMLWFWHIAEDDTVEYAVILALAVVRQEYERIE